ncbi:MAG TPA: plastocyanin/azurin family copper-binding protein [Actinomycetota bacterium]|nr:plastocyanin/azurin family copper-binding protein [Actinomycetota bacterium]
MDRRLLERLILPVALPVGALLAILVIAVGLSRVLLAVSAEVAATVAIALAVHVLLVASLVAALPGVRPARVRGLVAITTVVVVVGGIVASRAIPSGHHEQDHGASPATTLEVAAEEMAFTPNQLTASSGMVEFTMTNAGAIAHTLVIEGIDGFKLATPASGDTDSGTVTLGAGSYVYFCDVPGHREAGMEGQLETS